MIIIKNLTDARQQVVTYSIEPFGQVVVDDSYKSHPQVQLLVTRGVISISTSLATDGIQDALSFSESPSKDNPYVTKLAMQKELDKIVLPDKSLLPTTNEKNAMTQAEDPQGNNPFTTTSDTITRIVSALANHVATFDHSPNPLTANEVAALHASISPTAGNRIVTNSELTSSLSAAILTHAGLPAAHHSPVNDPSANQKAAMNAASSPGAGNKFLVQTDMDTHAGNASAHHSNVNDPSTLEKQAMAASLSPSTGNPFVTNTSRDAAIVAQIAAHAALPTAHHTNVNDPTTDEKAAMTAATAPGASNRFLTASDLGTTISTAISAHAIIPGAHHSPANDPTVHQKAALDASLSPTAANYYVVLDQFNAHATDPLIHTPAANSPSAGEKAALAGTSGAASGTNKYVTDQDSRNTNARTPLAHASSHINGSDDIPLATTLVKGLMSPSDKTRVTEVDINEGVLSFLNASQAQYTGKLLVNGELMNSTFTLAVTDFLINASGASTGAGMVASTLYYIYLSNSSAPTFPSSLRGSTSSTVSDANWRQVGLARTNGSGVLADEFSIWSAKNEPTRTKTVTLTGTQVLAAPNVFEEIGTTGALYGGGLTVFASVPTKVGAASVDVEISINGFCGYTQTKVSGIYEQVIGNVFLTGTGYVTISLQMKVSNITSNVVNKDKVVFSVKRV